MIEYTKSERELGNLLRMEAANIGNVKSIITHTGDVFGLCISELAGSTQCMYLEVIAVSRKRSSFKCRSFW